MSSASGSPATGSTRTAGPRESSSFAGVLESAGRDAKPLAPPSRRQNQTREDGQNTPYSQGHEESAAGSTELDQSLRSADSAGARTQDKTPSSRADTETTPGDDTARSGSGVPAASGTPVASRTPAAPRAFVVSTTAPILGDVQGPESALQTTDGASLPLKSTPFSWASKDSAAPPSIEWIGSDEAGLNSTGRTVALGLGADLEAQARTTLGANLEAPAPTTLVGNLEPALPSALGANLEAPAPTALGLTPMPRSTDASREVSVAPGHTEPRLLPSTPAVAPTPGEPTGHGQADPRSGDSAPISTAEPTLSGAAQQPILEAIPSPSFTVSHTGAPALAVAIAPETSGADSGETVLHQTLLTDPVADPVIEAETDWPSTESVAEAVAWLTREDNSETGASVKDRPISHAPKSEQSETPTTRPRDLSLGRQNGADPLTGVGAEAGTAPEAPAASTRLASDAVGADLAAPSNTAPPKDGTPAGVHVARRAQAPVTTSPANAALAGAHAPDNTVAAVASPAQGAAATKAIETPAATAGLVAATPTPAASSPDAAAASAPAAAPVRTAATAASPGLASAGQPAPVATSSPAFDTPVSTVINPAALSYATSAEASETSPTAVHAAASAPASSGAPRPAESLSRPVASVASASTSPQSSTQAVPSAADPAASGQPRVEPALAASMTPVRTASPSRNETSAPRIRRATLAFDSARPTTTAADVEETTEAESADHARSSRSTVNPGAEQREARQRPPLRGRSLRSANNQGASLLAGRSAGDPATSASETLEETGTARSSPSRNASSARTPQSLSFTPATTELAPASDRPVFSLRSLYDARQAPGQPATDTVVGNQPANDAPAAPLTSEDGVSRPTGRAQANVQGSDSAAATRPETPAPSRSSEATTFGLTSPDASEAEGLEATRTAPPHPSESVEASEPETKSEKTETQGQAKTANAGQSGAEFSGGGDQRDKNQSSHPAAASLSVDPLDEMAPIFEAPGFDPMAADPMSETSRRLDARVLEILDGWFGDSAPGSAERPVAGRGRGGTVASAWLRAVRTSLNSQPADPDPAAWKEMTIELEDGLGSVNIRARRDSDLLSLQIQTTDPATGNRLTSATDRLQSELRDRYGAEVDLSFASHSDGHEQEQASNAGSGSGVSGLSTRSASDSNDSADSESRRGADRVWVG